MRLLAARERQQIAGERGDPADVALQHLPALTDAGVVVPVQPRGGHVHPSLETGEDVLDPVGQPGDRLPHGGQTLGLQLLLLELLARPKVVQQQGRPGDAPVLVPKRHARSANRDRLALPGGGLRLLDLEALLAAAIEVGTREPPGMRSARHARPRVGARRPRAPRRRG